MYESVNSKLIDFNFFDLLIPNEINLQKLQALNPTILVAQTSMLLVIADALINKGLKINPEKIIDEIYKKKPKLIELYKHLFNNKEVDGLHNSMMDVLVCLQCYLKMRHDRVDDSLGV